MLLPVAASGEGGIDNSLQAFSHPPILPIAATSNTNTSSANRCAAGKKDSEQHKYMKYAYQSPPVRVSITRQGIFFFSRVTFATQYARCVEGVAAGLRSVVCWQRGIRASPPRTSYPYAKAAFGEWIDVRNGVRRTFFFFFQTRIRHSYLTDSPSPYFSGGLVLNHVCEKTYVKTRTWKTRREVLQRKKMLIFKKVTDKNVRWPRFGV